MKKTLFQLSEINVLMWLAIFGYTMGSAGAFSLKFIAGAGLAVGAVMQHRAYYDIFKKKA
ncbi:MAG TPA: hypothetical protein VN887_15375 [Candidatus Angelobacter sp.]|nr:hypothetical protein [Candidatus Angelobacter sp.]